MSLRGYDHWKTTEPMDEYPGDGVYCPECHEMLQEDEFEESGCDKCGCPPPETEEDDEPTNDDAVAKKGGSQCE